MEDSLQDLITSIPSIQWEPQHSAFQRWPADDPHPFVVRHEGLSYTEHSVDINRIVFDLYFFSPIFQDNHYVYFA